MSSVINYIEEIYPFKGEWEMPSFCGLKVVKTQEKTIIIATEMYDSNPGSSVTSRAGQLATEIIRKFNIPWDQLIFIEHIPDRKSNLVFYDETFDIVSFQWDGNQFIHPSWKRVSAREVHEMMGTG